MTPLAVFHIDKAPSEGNLPFLLFALAVAISLFKRPKDMQDRDDNLKDLKDRVGSGQGQRQPTFLDQILLRSYQLVSATYCFDLVVIGYRLSQAQHSDSSTMSVASAKFAAWIAFTLNWIFLILDNKVPNTHRSHAIHHLLGWTALVGAFLSISPYLVHGARTLSSGDPFGPNVRLDRRILLPSLTEDILERVLIGTFALRFGLLVVTSALSSMQLFVGVDVNPLSLPDSLLKNSSTAPAPSTKLASESSSKKEQLEKYDAAEQFRATALDSFIPKVLLSMRLTYPMGNKKLLLLLAIRFTFMLVERVIHIMAPLQTERLLRMFSPEGKVGGAVSLSKFDVGSVLLYVFYNYLQRKSNIMTFLYTAAQRPLDGFVRDSLQLRFFEHLHSLSMQFHLEKRSMDAIDIMQMGVHSVTQLSNYILFTFVPTICDVTITLLYFSIVWGWKYSLLLVAHAVLIGITSKLHERMVRRMRRKEIGFNGVSRDHPTETLTNAETVKYFTNEAYEVARYKESIERPRRMMPVTHLKYQALSIVHTIIWTCNLLAGCLLCAYEISNEQRDPASFMTFVIYSQQLESPFQSLTWMSDHLRATLADIDEMMAIFKLEPTVKDIPDAPPLVISGGEIEFENVSFQYSPDKRGLSNISFKVLKGQTVGIVGPTGGGKTTILRLLVRFWDPVAGRILIDGQDISKVAQLSVRENIGAVPQDPVLFNDTIGYNINYGRTSATKEDIVAAAKVAQIHDNIMKFDNGYETSVGNRGAKLSGGERQRISIARTVLKNPPIIVMDEATSALDSLTESEIQQALNRMTKNRTTISVAHRLSTIMHADLILFVKDGEIVERGTHEELIQAAIDNGGQGEYYKMWRIQTGRFYGDSNSTVGENEMDTCSEGEENREETLKEAHKDVEIAAVSDALEKKREDDGS
ncbi:ATP-binding cassette sub- B member 6, mitochondrial [Linnemannia exigua]|uniref:ATP-binding cassette sub- B member 6, mitochondrial n=1 Tax=Linnemannia exigua TaxID=604196 RepID=A0AAD4D370_9FUNG|nr:ATP-binding cassette sub- B member 6, mitochondrial [Linnemannia exigua]